MLAPSFSSACSFFFICLLCLFSSAFLHRVIQVIAYCKYNGLYDSHYMTMDNDQASHIWSLLQPAACGCKMQGCLAAYPFSLLSHDFLGSCYL
ncbi:hypothetical protein AVEN_163826-1 [Araneus ventricosus]|uniref:Secreted protein n=1 Tax=Araneus ventricosus TaxID=182803 RepID=A0A4Y2NPF1_ARAVE|nr:hypothetical protein AVEN_163826-1 [Araneus ventricosus]